MGDDYCSADDAKAVKLAALCTLVPVMNWEVRGAGVEV